MCKAFVNVRTQKKNVARRFNGNLVKIEKNVKFCARTGIFCCLLLHLLLSIQLLLLFVAFAALSIGYTQQPGVYHVDLSTHSFCSKMPFVSSRALAGLLASALYPSFTHNTLTFR